MFSSRPDRTAADDKFTLRNRRPACCRPDSTGSADPGRLDELLVLRPSHQVIKINAERTRERRDRFSVR